MKHTRASWRGQHIIELKLSADHVMIIKEPTAIYLKMNTRTAQEIYDALRGLAPTLQPFEEIDKPN